MSRPRTSTLVPSNSFRDANGEWRRCILLGRCSKVLRCKARSHTRACALLVPLAWLPRAVRSCSVKPQSVATRSSMLLARLCVACISPPSAQRPARTHMRVPCRVCPRTVAC